MHDDVPPCNAEKSLWLCSLFESEILVWLVLRNWHHPLSEDLEYRSDLLESAAELLASACSNSEQIFVEGMPTQDMNLIAAIWYCESCALQAPSEHEDREARLEWLRTIRRSLPSCFYAQDDLNPS
jgi:hypothetical protein